MGFSGRSTQQQATRPSAYRAPAGVEVKALAGVGGFDWGFYSNEDPRMHVQVLNADAHVDYKVWLERDGARVFEPVGKIPARVSGYSDRRLRRVLDASKRSGAG